MGNGAAWPVRPRGGLGPLRFGMSRAAVAALPGAGAALRVLQGFDGSVSESRGADWPVCAFAGDALSGIDTTRRVPGVAFDGLEIYRAAPAEVLAALVAAERQAGGQGAMLLDDTLHFPALGIASTGFWLPEAGRPFRPGEDEDRRGLALSPPGAFEAWADEMEPVDVTGG